MTLSSELIEMLNKLTPEQAQEAFSILIKNLPTDRQIGLRSSATYEIWSPYDSGEAASVLMKMLEEDQRNHGD